MSDDERLGIIKTSVAPEIGADSADAVAVSLLPGAVPGFTVFSAYDTDKQGGQSINGLVSDAGQVVTGRRVLDTLIGAWDEGERPPPPVQAEVVTWLLAGNRAARVVDDANPPDHEPGPIVAGMLAAPEEVDGVLRFWWESRSGLARVEVSSVDGDVDHEVVQGFEFEDGTYDPAGFDADL